MRSAFYATWPDVQSCSFFFLHLNEITANPAVLNSPFTALSFIHVVTQEVVVRLSSMAQVSENRSKLRVSVMNHQEEQEMIIYLFYLHLSRLVF